MIASLKRNNEKTQSVWIGSNTNCAIKYMTDRTFCWDLGIFKVLGIRSTDTERISENNNDGNLTENRKILNKWSLRQLTRFGNLNVIKALTI